jgi:hypothetical protein
MVRQKDRRNQLSALLPGGFLTRGFFQNDKMVAVIPFKRAGFMPVRIDRPLLFRKQAG